jgi:glycosyltransferase involved in cell wall biosynthesis
MVSVVIPMYNEEQYIGRCVRSLINQDYPPGLVEVLVVDGLSSDRSADIVRSFAAHTPTVRYLENPRRITPVALNIGVRSAKGDVVIILGSHSYVEPDFVRLNVETLEKTGADCVGGRIETMSHTVLGKVASLAMSSSFGVGNARFRTSDKPGFVDTVAFGAYRCEVFDRIGYFDEELVRNQDDEFNFRLTRGGGRIYLEPAIRSSYFSRPTLKALWKQYFQYGRWKVCILRKHGSLPSVRHLVPATALVVFAVSLLAAALSSGFLWLPVALLALYVLTSLLFSLRLAVRHGPSCVLLPVAFATLHLSYATGFICGISRLLSLPGGKA